MKEVDRREPVGRGENEGKNEPNTGYGELIPLRMSISFEHTQRRVLDPQNFGEILAKVGNQGHFIAELLLLETPRQQTYQLLAGEYSPDKQVNIEQPVNWANLNLPKSGELIDLVVFSQKWARDNHSKHKLATLNNLREKLESMIDSDLSEGLKHYQDYMSWVRTLEPIEQAVAVCFGVKTIGEKLFFKDKQGGVTQRAVNRRFTKPEPIKKFLGQVIDILDKKQDPTAEQIIKERDLEPKYIRDLFKAAFFCRAKDSAIDYLRSADDLNDLIVRCAVVHYLLSWTDLTTANNLKTCVNEVKSCYLKVETEAKGEALVVDRGVEEMRLELLFVAVEQLDKLTPNPTYILERGIERYLNPSEIQKTKR